MSEYRPQQPFVLASVQQRLWRNPSGKLHPLSVQEGVKKEQADHAFLVEIALALELDKGTFQGVAIEVAQHAPWPGATWIEE